MSVKSTGQITIIDYYDAVSLTGFISTNHPLTQVYSPDNSNYLPDYSSSNMVLTPSLFKAGSGSDIIATTAIQSIIWTDEEGTTLTKGAGYGLSTFSSGSNRPLTIQSNILSGDTNSKTYICTIVYRDSSTSLDLTFKESVTINRITSSAGVTVPVATSPDGNIFKNNSGSDLSAKAELWRGSAIDGDSVDFQWYKQDSSITEDKGGGVGWMKLDATHTGGGTSNYTTSTLVIPASAVTGVATFKVGIKDTDSASPTHNQTFYATISFVDQQDPIQVVVESSAGNVFKQGIGSTTLTARLFQFGAEIDSGGSGYTYK